VKVRERSEFLRVSERKISVPSSNQARGVKSLLGLEEPDPM